MKKALAVAALALGVGALPTAANAVEEDTSFSCGGYTATFSGGDWTVVHDATDDEVTNFTVHYLETPGVTTDVNTGGDDLWRGTDGDDHIISRGGGVDVVCSGQGNDFLQLAGGSDWADAGQGDDTVYGGADADVIYGGPGSDDLYGRNLNTVASNADDSESDWVDGGPAPRNERSPYYLDEDVCYQFELGVGCDSDRHFDQP